MDVRVGDASAGDEPAVGHAVGLIGGTGRLGRGLATRFAAAGHRVLIGSRDAARAHSSATQISNSVVGVSNTAACDADLVLVTVPWSAHDETLAALSLPLRGRVVVDCVNPLGFDERGPFALSVPAGSAAERAQELLPQSAVVGAFHHISAELLLNPTTLDGDVLVVGDDREAVDQVIALASSIVGLRGVFAGRLRNAGQVEALTANLIAINRRYRVQAGLQIAGLGLSRPNTH
ncbi:MAG: NADPH-dependent F420 reductase [Actinomycetes bacterium]